METYKKALASSFRILSKKAYSRYEIEKKLINLKYTNEVVEQTLETLDEMGLICDLDYANEIIYSYKTRGYGINRIKQELFKRGIEKDDVLDAMQEFYTDYEMIVSYYSQKLGGNLEDYKLIDKTKAFLQRKGYTFDEINKAFSMYREQLEDF